MSPYIAFSSFFISDMTCILTIMICALYIVDRSRREKG